MLHMLLRRNRWRRSLEGRGRVILPLFSGEMRCALGHKSRAKRAFRRHVIAIRGIFTTARWYVWTLTLPELLDVGWCMSWSEWQVLVMMLLRQPSEAAALL